MATLIDAKASNSSSPTDTFILTFPTERSFYPFTKYNEITKNIVIMTNKIFYKVYIDADSIIGPYDHREELNAATYEFKIYRDVIRPLLDFMISPHFIRFYTIQEGLSINEYTQFLHNVFPPVDDNQILRNLYYMYNMIPARPRLTDAYVAPTAMAPGQPQLPMPIATNLRLNFIGLMPTDNTTTSTLEEFLITNFPNNTAISDTDIARMHIIYFQLLQAIYSLYLSKTTHNDLHYGNVWVTIRPAFQNIRYVINGVTFNIRTNICVRIYDFDRAYSVRLGNNPINTTRVNPNPPPPTIDYCALASQCNELIPMKDFIKVYSYIHRYLNKDFSASIDPRLRGLRSATNIPNKNLIQFSEINPLCVDDFCFLRNAGGIPFSAADYQNWINGLGLPPAVGGDVQLAYLIRIYNRIQRYDTSIPKQFTFTNNPDFTYTLNNSFFDLNGVYQQRINDCCI